MVERVVRTLKEEVIWLRDWDTVEEVAAAVEAWRQRYNHDRPHQALAWRTPAEQRRLLLRVPELAPRQEAA